MTNVENTDDKTRPAQNLDKQITPESNLNSVDFNKIGYFWYRQYVSICSANVIISSLPAATAISDDSRTVLKDPAYFYWA